MAQRGDISGYINGQLALLTRCFARALSTDDVDAVHDLRVASRRLEEPLVLCGAICKGDAADRAVKRLKRIRKGFRHVREFDVLGESFAKSAGGLSEAEMSLLREAVAERREREYHEAIENIDGSQLDAVERALANVLKRVNNTKGVAADWLTAGMRSLLNERVDAVFVHDPEQGEARDLHLTRVSLKRLRYAVELRSALQEDADNSVLERLKAVQDRLGEWNDHLAAARTVMAIARKRATLLERPAWVAAVLGYAAERVKMSRELQEAFLREWPAVRAGIAELKK